MLALIPEAKATTAGEQAVPAPPAGGLGAADAEALAWGASALLAISSTVCLAGVGVERTMTAQSSMPMNVLKREACIFAMMNFLDWMSACNQDMGY